MSYYCITMSIGLLVDFNLHILLRYLESRLPNRQEKVKDALTTMGSSVALGGLSTFLGVVPLMFSSSDITMILFYSFWGMVILGCSHGLILLPVVLSFVGPENIQHSGVN
jgi:predicted RND superfamily exporter protein